MGFLLLFQSATDRDGEGDFETEQDVDHVLVVLYDVLRRRYPSAEMDNLRLRWCFGDREDLLFGEDGILYCLIEGEESLEHPDPLMPEDLRERRLEAGDEE